MFYAVWGWNLINEHCILVSSNILDTSLHINIIFGIRLSLEFNIYINYSNAEGVILSASSKTIQSY